MSFSDSFFNKVERKTNVNKQTILNLASKLKNEDLKNESTIRSVIDELASITGKNVTETQKEKIINAVVGDKIPDNIENML